MSSSENISPVIVKLVSRDMQKLVNSPLEGIFPIMNEDNVTDVQAWIVGPDGTPYEGGFFRLRLTFGTEFPAAPPKCFFTTKIYHPNISKTGEVCVNHLKKDWRKELGIAHIFLIVKSLLHQPNPESALNSDAGMLLLTDEESFTREARLMTSIHATNNIPAEIKRALQVKRENSQQPDNYNSASKSDSENKSEYSSPATAGEAVSGGKVDVLRPNNGASSPMKRNVDKKLEKSKMDKKRSLKRL